MHYLLLTAILCLGTILRFWQLDRKPLWIDEIITALFGLGKGFENLPLEQVLAVDRIPDIFILNPQTQCSEIASYLTTQSTHPPFFFCALHQWLLGIDSWDVSLAWKLRSLPAILGVFAIAAIYLLNRLAFSPQAGLMAAAMMTVSPFAVYLSQEARHYTLPILLLIFALCCLILIQKQLQKKKYSPLLWLLWGSMNCLGIYVHYFYIFAIIAQFITLFLVLYRTPKVGIIRLFWLFILAIAPFLFYLPWLPILLEHFNSPKTSWLPAPNFLLPILQTLGGWSSMFIALPVEKQPLWLQIVSITFTVIFMVWAIASSLRGLRKLYASPNTRESTITLSCFTLCVLLEFAAIIYILGKDISIAPRYHFIYYPGFCALIAASFSRDRQFSLSSPRSTIIFLLVGAIGSLCVIFNFAFQKPYYPLKVAQQFNQSSDPVMVMMAYENTLEIATGLSYALTFADIHDRPAYFTFLNKTDFGGFEYVWRSLSQFPLSPASLWAIVPGYVEASYPREIALKNSKCTIDPKEHYRIGGFPYQLYHCDRAG
ncbi:glycosyltransferase family 39 protein [Spirulina sp. 06S082]|uniref:glycosyltransferase family 39 protein n=1 Tax=Spirulina sp. 06S082 TaxID=3110248 RepID=UPI002B21E13E|nr:glycosyltransferase family 39 protein [Spirulina sp. 06S082]MEA5471866.1 glycosyltransferase family 39 protein [Spirulina sp. 06S082]